MLLESVESCVEFAMYALKIEALGTQMLFKMLDLRLEGGTWVL